MRLLTLYRRGRTVASEEDGISLVEMVVALMLVSIASAVFLGVMTSVYTGVNRQQRRSDINDEARLAIQQIDREVRSGDILFDPTENCGGGSCVPSFSVRVYRRPVYASDSGLHRCVQWLVQGGRLLRRSWRPGQSSTPWRVLANDIVNRDVTPTVPAFIRNAGGRVLDVTLLVNNRLGQPDAPRTVRIESSIAIRNYGTGDPCSPIPPTS